LLFSDVSFKVAPGSHAGLVGVNGVGKSTLMRILAGRLLAVEGEATHGGSLVYMAQDVGVDDNAQTVRELLLSLAPGPLRRAGEQVVELERRLASGDDPDAGIALGEAIGDWSALGGYALEAQWDVSCRQIVRFGFVELAERPAQSLSGGERKQLVLDVLLRSDADVLLLDEPDNFLDVPAKLALERRIRESRKTILMISHDREVLAGAVGSIITLEGHGAWVHGESYATYPEARRRRQERMGDAVRRWHEEEKRLREQTRLWKERARYSPDLRPERGSLAVFPSGRPLPSPTSAPACAGLFGGIAGTTSLSDFSRSSIKGLPPKRSPHGPPSVDLPPREPSRTGHHQQPCGRPRDLPVLAHGARRACLGSPTAQGPPATRESVASSVAFRQCEKRRHPELVGVSRLNSPAHTPPVNASLRPHGIANA